MEAGTRRQPLAESVVLLVASPHPEEARQGRREGRTRLKALSLLGALVLSAGPADAQRLERGQTVLDRPRPLYQARGVRLGTFVLKPALDLRQTYVDNPRARSSGGDGDHVGEIIPSFDLRSDWGRHGVGLRARGRLTRHARHPSEDTESWRVAGHGRVEIGERTSARLNGGWARRFEDRASPDDPGGRSPTAFRQLTGGLVVRTPLYGLLPTLRADVQRFDYRDGTAPDGTRIDNGDRDHTRYSVAGRTALRLTKRLELVARGAGNVRAYDAPFDDNGFVRGSYGWEAAGGARADLTGVTVVEATFGWRRQEYLDSALSAISGLAADIEATSSVTELTSLRLGLTREVLETTIPEASGGLATRGRLRVDHELLRNLLLHAGAAYERTVFEGIGRQDGTLRLELGARYLMNPWLHWSLALRHTRRDSDAVGADYRRTAVSLTARLQY